MNKGLVSFDARRRLNSCPFQRAPSSDGDRGCLGGHGVAALCLTRPGGNDVGRLALAYAGNPDMNQQRAGVRASDENLPRATSTWRPTATANAQYGYNHLEETSASGSSAGASAVTGIMSSSAALRANTATWTYGLTVTQKNLFNRQPHSERRAAGRSSNIFRARETMRNWLQENVLLNGATAYMDVLRDIAILESA